MLEEFAVKCKGQSCIIHQSKKLMAYKLQAQSLFELRYSKVQNSSIGRQRTVVLRAELD